MRLVWVLLSAVPALLGQDLRVSPVMGAPGQGIALEISLNSPPGKAALVLRWELVFPAQLVDPDGNDPETGPAAKNSGKSVTCARRKAYSVICVVAGGQKPIANGAVAILHFKIREDARAGMSAFKIEGAEAASIDMKEIFLKDAEGTLTIQ